MVAADGDRFLPSGLPELLRNVMRFPRNAAIALLSPSRSASNSAMIVPMPKKPSLDEIESPQNRNHATSRTGRNDQWAVIACVAGAVITF